MPSSVLAGVSLVYLGLAAKTEYQPVRVEWLDELEIRHNSVQLAVSSLILIVAELERYC